MRNKKTYAGVWINRSHGDGITYTKGTFTYMDNGKKRRRWTFTSRFTNSKFTHFYDSLKEIRDAGWRKVR